MNTLSRAEGEVVLLGSLFLFGCALWAFVRWLTGPPRRPDPWDEAITLELAEGNGTPLCHHCLTPHDPSVDFCPQCGAAVGLYTNYLPFPRLFSIGHTFRIGTNENFKRSFLTIGGFLFLSLIQYGVFFPVYWFRLIQNLSRKSLPAAESTDKRDSAA